MRQALRPYQTRAIEEVRSRISRGTKRVLIVAPTGAGKTTVAAEIIHGAIAKGSRSLFLAHRTELIDQCSARLDQWSVDHGIIQAQHWRWRPKELVQVASVQSLLNRLRSRVVEADARLLIVDEAHRSTAATYEEIIDRHAGAVLLGLTATPVRKNGKGLGTLYDDMVIVAQPNELIADGFLMKPTIYIGSVGDLSGVHVRDGDFIEHELAAAMDKPKLIGDVVENWTKIVGRDKRTVAFGCTVEHSQNICGAFERAGVRAAHIDGTTPRGVRDRVLADLRAGSIEVVTNCQILTEGWDLPALDAVILARPTKSLALCLQMIGRVLRPHPGKDRALVLDHGGNVDRHGWPTADREWSLQNGVTGEDVRVAPVKNCPNCGCAVPCAEMTCPECGFLWTKAVRDGPEVVPGELVEASEEQLSPTQRMNKLIKWVVIARRNRMKTAKNGFPGFAAHRFREEFGRWPTADEMLTALERTRHVLRGERTENQP